MQRPYVPPKTLHKWTNDIPGGELHEVFILDNRTVCSTAGRYSHSSGSSSCGWDAFLDGRLNEVVQRTMGEPIFQEVLVVLKQFKLADTGT